MDVKAFWLDVNQTFPDREILAMCVAAKEANIGGINFVCLQSDVWDFQCTSPRFSVIAHQSKARGLHISTACIREGDEFFGIDD
jgi:hypothetical protein